MPELKYVIEAVDPLLSVDSVPSLHVRLRLTNSTPASEVRSVSLRCQVHIDAARRRYSEDERRALFPLFGTPAQWSSTVRSLFLGQVTQSLPGFRDLSSDSLSIPCPLELNFAAATYLTALREGDIPLVFLFSGTVFFGEGDAVQSSPIPWSNESKYRLPLAAWNGAIPESAHAQPHELVADLLKRARSHAEAK
jgi:hypothetical protein